MKYDFKIKGKRTTYHFRINNFSNRKKTIWDKITLFWMKERAKFEAKKIVKDCEAIPIVQYKIKREFVFKNLKELLEYRT